MSQEEQDQRIDYVEFAATDVAAVRGFYETVLGWKFEDYGPDYTSFSDGRLGGGFRKADTVNRGGALAVLYATDLAGTEAKIKQHGGTIVQETFEFPGGRRFHFTDPAGNELAVWSDR
jgi:predicted enzyme related to lactoylglutathione lyase